MNTKNIRNVVAVLAGLLFLNAMPMIALADNPVPVISSISPNSVNSGSGALTLTVNGSNFVSGATVNINGASRSTTFVSANQLTAIISQSDVSSNGTFNITVTNPAPGGGTSAAMSFVVGNTTPSTTSISPTSVSAGAAAFNLTVNGTNFAQGSVVNVNGTAKPTTFVSSSQLTAALNPSDVSGAGSFVVSVTNTNGVTSNPQTLSVTGNNPTPLLVSISPSSAFAGNGGLTLTVNGSNFTNNSAVFFNGLPATTSFISSSQLSAVVPASSLSTTGTYAVYVNNPLPGGGTSGALIFTVEPSAGTPGLPNTGFGATQNSALTAGIIAAIAALGISLGAFATRRLWLVKK